MPLVSGGGANVNEEATLCSTSGRDDAQPCGCEDGAKQTSRLISEGQTKTRGQGAVRLGAEDAACLRASTTYYLLLTTEDAACLRAGCSAR